MGKVRLLNSSVFLCRNYSYKDITYIDSLSTVTSGLLPDDNDDYGDTQFAIRPVFCTLDGVLKQFEKDHELEEVYE